MNPVTFDDWLALTANSVRGDDGHYGISGEIAIPLNINRRFKNVLFLSFDSLTYTVEGYSIAFYCNGEGVAMYNTVGRYVLFQRTEQVFSVLFPSVDPDDLARYQNIGKSYTATFKVTPPSLIKAIKD